ncbi:hypothetical protein YC2023_100345 [Brassica napus]
MSWKQHNMKVLVRQHEERGYRFRWRCLIVGTAGVYSRFLRPGILKTHCFGLVAGDKCHDIADHFSYVGSGCHIIDDA